MTIKNTTWQDMIICKAGGKQSAINSDYSEGITDCGPSGLPTRQTATLYLCLKKESNSTHPTLKLSWKLGIQ